jgi:uncharacterized protein
LSTIAATIHWSSGAESYDSDCACSAPSGMPLHQSVSADRWQITPELYRDSLSQEHELVFSPISSGGVGVLNRSAGDVLAKFTQPQPLDSEIARTMARLGLLAPSEKAAVPAPTNTSDTLTVWLHVTNACNLRCNYCYLNKNTESMKLEVGKAAVDAALRSVESHGYRILKLKYAGGEASLQLDLIRSLHRYAAEQADKRGIRLQGVVLSNGVSLSEKMLAILVESDLRLSISLDGIGFVNDIHRITVSGRGTFDRVDRGIQRTIDFGLSPHLSITVTQANVEALPEVVGYALERSLLFNLNFYRDGETTDDLKLRADNEALTASLYRVFGIIEDWMPAYSLLGSLIDKADFSVSHSNACSAGHSYLVVDQNGSIARCQMEIEQPITSIHQPDPLEEIRLHSGGFQNRRVEEKEGCRTCSWRYWCAGGCPLLTYRATGRNDVKSPYCDVYRAVYPGLLRLEGLRLLKWESPIMIA